MCHIEPNLYRRLSMVCLMAVLLALLAGYPPSALARAEDRQQPIEVEADSVEFDEGRNQSIYRGNVILVQGSLRLEAERVTVQHRDRQPALIIAEGQPVKFQQQTDEENSLIRGRAQRAEYAVDSEEVVLIGDALLTQGNDSFRSDRIVYDRVAARIKAGAAAQGSERVRITITPPADGGQGE
jgi:lipopolysaccharide export system protein LptA